MYEMMRAYFHDRRRCRLLQDRLAAGLTEDERQFLQAAEIGQLDIIKELLGSGKVKVDCCDQQGRTALEMAVTGNDVDVVCYLLERSSGKYIHKALLAAADNDMERICELILDHPLYRESVRKESERRAAADRMAAGFPDSMASSAASAAAVFAEEGGDRGDEEDDKFSSRNLSKLLLEVLLRAAKRNNFQIVKKIMMCGVFLEEPHDYFCACQDCTDGRTEDFKVYTTRRLDTYTALASPAYISLTAEDPIMSAFYLSKKFRNLSEIEGEYKQIYSALDEQVQNFTLALLDQCQSSEEVKAVLSGRPKKEEFYSNGGGPRAESKHGADENDYVGKDRVLPMVYTAVRMEQKKFAAHAQCQAQIGELWYSGVPFLRYLNRFAYLMLAIPIGIACCPVLSALYLATPSKKVSRIVNTPLMKFLNYTCSYLTFLILVVVAKLYVRHYIDSFSCERPDTMAYVMTVLVFMWIIGLIVEECKQIFASGARDYFASFWNVIDSFMLSFLLASFVLEIVTPLRLYEIIDSMDGLDSDKGGSNLNYYKAVGNGSLLSIFIPLTARDRMYKHGQVPTSPVCERSRNVSMMTHHEFCDTKVAQPIQVEWDPSWVPDPELLSDVLFSCGIILSVSRFSFIMPANEALGTMLVSFRRTVSDIVKIFGMFLLVLVAFTCGIAALYAPNTCITSNFGSFSSTLNTLTWSMFGMGSLDAPKLNLKGHSPVYSLTNNPGKTSGAATVGRYLYGIYVFSTMVVLLNLLIAVMSNTFQEVQDERDVEWKFARTELWLTFIEPGTPVMPPFNIVPSPRHIYRLLLWLCRRSQFRHLLPHEGKKVRYVAVQTGSTLELQDMEEEKSEESNIDGHYTRNDVMSMLIRRYVRHIERMKIEGEDGESTSSDEQLRRQIERLSSRLEQRMSELYNNLGRVQRELDKVKAEGSESSKLQIEHYDKFVEFSGRKVSATDRYEALLDEAKLQILARMDSERIQMERVLEHRVGTLARKLDESTISLSQQVDRLQALTARGSSPGSSSSSPLHKPKY